MTLIPGRSTSRYAGHYARAVDPQRLLQIFVDSRGIALNSKAASTARARFELAVEAYHQLMSMTLSADVPASVQDAMIKLADQFPTQLCLNEALGLCAVARKLKTARRKLEYPQRARDVLQAGLVANLAGATAIQAMYDHVLADIAEAEAGPPASRTAIEG